MQLSHGWFIHKHNQQQIREQVANAAYFLHQYIDSRETNLHYATRVIIQDFGFREAVATNNVPTITSMLTNHAGRIQADLMLVLNDNAVGATKQLCFSPDGRVYDGQTWLPVEYTCPMESKGFMIAVGRDLGAGVPDASSMDNPATGGNTDIICDYGVEASVARDVGYAHIVEVTYNGAVRVE